MKKIPDKGFYTKLYIVIGLTALIFSGLLFLVLSGSTEKIQATLAASRQQNTEAVQVTATSAPASPKATSQTAGTSTPAPSSAAVSPSPTASASAPAAEANSSTAIPNTAVK